MSRNPIPISCLACGAPRGELVTRQKLNPTKWALDTDLAYEWPKTWGTPSRVQICASGLCRKCDGMKEKSA